jgi:hypothetical protein
MALDYLRVVVECRFHDLRHTACTRLLDAGVSHPVVAEIIGWSASTAIRMIREVYGHINLATRQRAMEQLEQFMSAQNSSGSAQKSAQFRGVEKYEDSVSLTKEMAPQVGLEPTTLRLTAGT